jgi:hypothetical protein
VITDKCALVTVGGGCRVASLQPCNMFVVAFAIRSCSMNVAFCMGFSVFFITPMFASMPKVGNISKEELPHNFKRN